MSVCCRIQLCCDPPGAAKALGEWLLDENLGDPEDEAYSQHLAAKLLDAYQLVPKEVEVGGPATSDTVTAGAERLAALHAHIKAELLEILPALGHPVK